MKTPDVGKENKKSDHNQVISLEDETMTVIYKILTSDTAVFLRNFVGHSH